MVRCLSIAVLTAVSHTVIAASAAHPQQPGPIMPSVFEFRFQPAQIQEQQPRSRARDVAVSELNAVLVEILWPALQKLDSAELAGLAAGANPGALTLEQSYTLTLIRARAPAASRGKGATKTFDPKALEEDGKLANAGDFERFRREFCSSDFRDPVSGFLSALKHRHAVETARGQVALTENVRGLMATLIKSENAGMSRLHVEQVELSLLLSRQQLAIELSNYRSDVDKHKLAIGLPVATPLVLDERILQPFTTGFTALDTWHRNPNRRLEELKEMHDRLPRLEELKVGAQSLDDVVQGVLPEENFLLHCVEIARMHRPALQNDPADAGERDALELRIRHLARALILLQKNYEVARKRLEVSARVADQFIEQMTAPPLGPKTGISPLTIAALQIPAVMKAQLQLSDARNDFVALWLQFKEQSLELHRELGVMPYDNWEAFHRSFIPVAGRAEPR